MIAQATTVNSPTRPDQDRKCLDLEDRKCFLEQAEIVKDALSKMQTLPLYSMPELVTQFATDIAELLKKQCS